MDKKRFPILIQQLYSIIAELEGMFPGRHFTPDGHLVGSIGEALAAHHYGLELLPASNKGCDATKNGVEVEIKATQGNRVAFRNAAEHVLVLKLHRDGSFKEIYNGPGDLIWDEFKGKPLPSNGQFQISLARLATMAENIPPKNRIGRFT